MAKRCHRCFSDRSSSPWVLVTSVLLCKGCAIEIDRALGFLAFYGVSVQPPLIPPSPEAVFTEQMLTDKIPGGEHFETRQGNEAEAPPVPSTGRKARKSHARG